ncbi:FAD-binding oxidoreductase [Puniceibacterium sp. IMCC21224]|uniref:NAD(P)/FAD-dependent oxidoreductase n=1 Tax=Puniceibacterium sp. IMCC21224 TaxID=1618204 RepID=UPI00064DBC8C|nr:FAD-binding oxidoreductase [Puniceibacterium sp. IMCC21224]KMK67722.1 glycine/D-amino acid oxidase, deaminating [Puniceibacterium sp. IMCC21224]
MTGFPFSIQTPPEHDAALPASVDVVIIGGGIIGISTALCLARSGVSVVVLEKGRVAAEQSSRNWGWIRVQGRDLAEIPIAHEAQRLWLALDGECHGRLGVRQIGVTYLARKPRDLAGFEDWLREAAPLGVSSRMVSRDALRDVLSGAQGDWPGALHTPTDLKAEPWVAVPELARLACSKGATLIEHCAVRGLDLDAGRVTGVLTEKGRIRTAEVLLAGGAWSSLFLRRHGVDIPQLSVRSTALETGPLPQVGGTAAVDHRMAFRPRADGGYTLAPSTLSELYVGPDSIRALGKYAPLLRQGGFDVRLHVAAPRGYPDAWGTPRRWSDDSETPFERLRVLNPAPNVKKARAACAAFAKAFPDAGEVRPRTLWAGMIDVMPDVVPVVDRVAALPGLTVVTGMCGHGFGIGPAFGRIASDLIRGNDPGVDLTRFRMARFSDGSRMVPGPNI